jgi:hypothetical protein
MGIRTLKKFRVLLGRSALECYKLLKEGLGTHASSYETVHWLVTAIKNGWEETDSASRSGTPTLAADERHMEQVKCFMQGNCYRSPNLSSQCLLSPH